MRDWPEIPKSEIPLSEFCTISGDWEKFWIPNLARISLIEYCLKAAKFQGYSFYRFWVVKGKPTGGWISPSRQITGNVLISILSPSENRLKIYSVKFIWKHIYLNLFISEIFVYVCFSFLLETKRITRLLFKISLRFVNGIHHK